ncbi:hypothetical protein OAO01_06840 [Oligoflexia bacterium]|nr:hypothetical protein [Oligoflexia bacterium]
MNEVLYVHLTATLEALQWVKLIKDANANVIYAKNHGIVTFGGNDTGVQGPRTHENLPYKNWQETNLTKVYLGG